MQPLDSIENNLLAMLKRYEDPDKQSKMQEQADLAAKRYKDFSIKMNRLFATEDGKILAKALLNESQFFVYDNNNERALNLSGKRDLVKFVLINAIEPALLASIMKDN